MTSFFYALSFSPSHGRGLRLGLYSEFLWEEDFKRLWVSSASPTWPFVPLLENGLLPLSKSNLKTHGLQY